MYTVEVRTAFMTGNSNIHAWLRITRPDGTAEAWGFYPDTDSLGNYMYGPGEIREEYSEKEFSGTSEPLEISEEQYNLLKSYIEISDAVPPDYSLFSLPPAGLQCSTWALVALNQIGIVPSTLLPQMAPFIGSLIWNPLSARLMVDALIMEQSIADLFNSAYNWIRRCEPLTLDLDGDGIETVGASSSNPILFDHDNDGIRTGTGWVAPDDALLMLDRNGNGAIDNGGELFGDSTTLSNGAQAFDGFAALAEMDSNADGVVDAADAQFANLRIWRDLNQDAISQTDELSTLTVAFSHPVSVSLMRRNSWMRGNSRGAATSHRRMAA